MTTKHTAASNVVSVMRLAEEGPKAEDGIESIKKGMAMLKQRLTLSFGLEAAQWNAATEKYSELFTAFITAKTPETAGRLFFYMDEAWEKLMVTPYRPTHVSPTTKIMVMWQKPSDEKRNFLQVVRFEELCGDTIAHMCQMYGGLIIPALPKANPRWPRVVVKELIYQIRLFVAQLQHHRGCLDNLVTLPLPSMEQLNVHAAKEELVDRKDLALLEQHAISWAQYLREAIAETSPLDKEVSGKLPPLSEEVEFWRLRYRKMRDVVKQLEGVTLNSSLNVLRSHGSAFVQPIESLRTEIDASMAECDDIFRHIGTLRRYLGLLEGGKILELEHTLPCVLHVLCLIWKSSTNFGLTRLITVLRCICNVVITTATDHVDVEALWQLDPRDALKKVTYTLDVCARFKSNIFSYRAQINSTHPTRQWNFEHSKALVRLDIFVSRLQGLVAILECIVHYDRIKDLEFGGLRNDMQVHNIRMAMAEFQRTLQTVRGASTIILDVFKNDFDPIYKAFLQDVQHCDRCIASSIASVTRQSHTTQHSLRIFELVASVLQRSAVRIGLEASFNEVLQGVSVELDKIMRGAMTFEVRPPLMDVRLPPTVAALQWVRGMQQRVTFPLDAIRRLVRTCFVKSDCSAVIEKGTRILSMLRKQEEKLVEVYGKRLTQMSLDTDLNLLKRKPNGTYIVTFDQRLAMALQELRMLLMLNIDIPSSAEHIVRAADSLVVANAKMDLVGQQYNTVNEALTEIEVPLVQATLNNIAVVLKEGESDVKWRSQNLSTYVSKVSKQVSTFHGTVMFARRNYEVILRHIKLWKDVHKVINFSEQGKEIKKRNALGELTAMWAADAQGLSDKERKAKRCLRRWKQKVAFQVNSVDDIEVQGRRIHRLMENTREALCVDPESPEWRTYRMHIQTVCQRGIITAQRRTLERLAELLEHDTENVIHNSMSKFFQASNHLIEIKFELLEREVVFTPSVHRDDFGSVQMRVFDWVNTVYSVSRSVRRLDDPTKSFYEASLSSIALNQLKDDIVRLMHLTLEKVEHLRMGYVQLRYLWTDSADTYAHSIADTRIADSENFEVWEAEITRFEELIQNVTSRPEIITYGWLRVDCSPMRSKVLILLSRWKATLLRALCNAINKKLHDFHTFISKKDEVFKAPVKTYDQLLGVMTHFQELHRRTEGYNEMLHPLRQAVAMLRRHDAPLPADILQQVDGAGAAWNYTKKLVVSLQQSIHSQQTLEAQRLREAESSFLASFNTFREKKFMQRLPVQRLCNPRLAYKIIEELHLQVKAYEERLESLRERQGLFGVPQCICTEIPECRRSLRHCKDLWDCAAIAMYYMDSWKLLPFHKTEMEVLEINVRRVIADVRSVDPVIKNWEAWIEINKMLKNFMVSIPLIGELRNPAMKKQHWDELIAAHSEFNLANDDVTMEQFVDLKLHENADQVGQLVDKAVRQQQIAAKLADIKKHWEAVCLTSVMHSGTSIVVIPEDFHNTIEEHQIQLHVLLATRHSGTFMDELQSWRGTLTHMESMITQLSDVQHVWLYLANIFIDNEDISRQRPEDTKAFQEIDSQIKSILRLVLSTPRVLDFCAREGFGQWLTRLRRELSQCERVLDQFLMEKRKKVPRFFFLSTSDMLDILSSVSKQPTQISRYMGKLMPGVEKIEFSDTDAISLLGVGKETVTLSRPVACKGRIEEWLINMEQEIRATVVLALSAFIQGEHRLEALVTKNIDTQAGPGVHNLLGQVSLLINNLVHCTEVTAIFASMDEENEQPMREHKRKIEDTIESLGKMVIEESLPEADMIRLRNLIMCNVRNRDVIAELIRSKAQSVMDFGWQRQLRHRMDDRNRKVIVDICDATFDYNFEYLGNTLRLVMTPLTDRIYVTLTQALRLKLGGAPSGPSGTGKTETTKDLGAQLGKAVFVFSCSEQMTARGVEQIFKGIAVSGCWGCLDEINHIRIDVLSVMSSVLKSITDARREAKKMIHFGTDLMPLDISCGIFITLDPGQHERTGLPESLKSLFRPVTVMSPELTLIAENILLSEGFRSAQSLARKVILLFKMCTDLLSKQCHYDWGLRAVKSLLLHAGSIRRSSKNCTEEEVIAMTIHDLNGPKIVELDQSIFASIIKDIFPKAPTMAHDPSFAAHCRKACPANGIQPDESVIQKARQLHDLLSVRHCVFLLGPAACGKTTLRKTLVWARRVGGTKVMTRELDPKVVPTAELYGSITPSKEWRDGLLATLIKELLLPSNEDYHRWIVLDGDIDTNWIESMNSLMDDNKVLTLASHERITLHPNMRLLFEASGLENTTPATVSRAGILYVNAHDIGYPSMVQTYFDGQSILSNIISLTDKYFAKCFEYILKEHKTVVPFNEMQLVRTVCVLLDTVLEPVPIDTLNEKDIEAIFAWCCISTFGSILDVSYGISPQVSFDKWWRAEWKSVRLPPSDHGTVFDFMFNTDTRRFERWSERLKKEPNPSINGMALKDIFIGTQQTASLSYHVESLLRCHHPVLIVGPSGSGKTLLVKECMARLPDSYLKESLTLTYASTVNGIQSSLEQHLERKLGRTFHPHQGRKLIYFVDDLNMPQADLYGTQAPLCFIRQHIDSGHFYERPKWRPIEVEGVQYVACMNTAVGNFTIDRRLQRHFAVFSSGEITQESLLTIFRYICSEHGGHSLMKHLEGELARIVTFHETLSKTLQKSSIKFTYEFSVRQVCAVFEGIMMAGKYVWESKERMLVLILHELIRTYMDSLMTEQDVTKAKEVMHKVFGLTDSSAESTRALSQVSDPKGVYGELKPPDAVRSTLESAIVEYSKEFSKLDVAFFNGAIQHVCRVSRALRMARRNMLLLGMYGSAKQSCAKLAAYVCKYLVRGLPIAVQPSLSSFREGLKTIFTRVGLRGEQVLLVMTEADLFSDFVMVDLVSFISAGSVPGLYSNDEVDDVVRKISSDVRAASIVVSRENCWNFFLQRIQERCRMVFCLSPGDAFRTRTRHFPSLITCTQVDWFLPWTPEAYEVVANRFLSSEGTLLEVISMRTSGGDDTKSIVDFLCFAHAEAEREAHDTFETTHQKVTVSPRSFSDLLRSFHTILSRHATATVSLRQCYLDGVMKIEEATRNTHSHVEVLARTRGLAAEKKHSADALLRKLDAERSAVQIERAKAQAEEAVAQDIQRMVEESSAHCKESLASSLPLLDKAEKALSTLNKTNLTELKALRSPPQEILDVLACIIILFSAMGQGAAGTVSRDRSWAAALKLMGRVENFLQALQNFNKDEIPDYCVSAMKPYLSNPEFNGDAIAPKSFAAAGLCEWVRNVVEYRRLIHAVAPKKSALEEMKKKFEESQSKVMRSQNAVIVLQQKLNDLESQYTSIDEERKRLLNEVVSFEIRLTLSNRLVTAFGSDCEKWRNTAEQIQLQYENVVGDALFAACFQTYCAPFPLATRQRMMQRWSKRLETLCLAMSQAGADPVYTLTTAADRATWFYGGLRTDTVSIQNVSVMRNTRRGCIVVDPQKQMLDWMISAFQPCVCVAYDARDLLAVIERAIVEGLVVIVKGVVNHIDPLMQRLLSKKANTRKSGIAFVQLGDKEVPLNEAFTLIIHSTSQTCNFSDEVESSAIVINCALTAEGLEESLLSTIHTVVNRSTEEDRQRLVKEMYENEKALLEVNHAIVSKLGHSASSLLDVALVESLERLKVAENEIHAKVERTVRRQSDIALSREVYRPLANRASLLYFILPEMRKINSMYQFSLESFCSLLCRVLNETEENAVTGGSQEDKTALEPLTNMDASVIFASNAVVTPQQRVAVLVDKFALALYHFIRRGLLERHKLSFSMLFTVTILHSKNLLDRQRAQLLLRGGGADKSNDRKGPPAPEGLLGKVWKALCQLQGVKGFERILVDVEGAQRKWQEWIQHQAPEGERLPGEWRSASEFDRLLLVQALRKDRLLHGVKRFVLKSLGPAYNDKVTAFTEFVGETVATVPVLFILTSGVDVMRDIEIQAKKCGYTTTNSKLVSIAMGDGQQSNVMTHLGRLGLSGGWLVLHNVHVMSGWISAVHHWLEANHDSLSSGFRLFLTAEPTDASLLPDGLVQHCLKVTSEPATSLKANLSRAFAAFNSDFLESSPKQSEFKSLLFSLCYFHSLVVGRCGFGAHGWSQPYSFNHNDLITCANVLFSYLELANTPIPFNTMKYIVGEVMYGGHVTDSWDRRVLQSYLDMWVSESSFTGGLIGPGFHCPSVGNYAHYLGCIDRTEDDTAATFGLHANSELAHATQEAEDLILNLSRVMAQMRGPTNNSAMQPMSEIVEDLLSKLPEPVAERDVPTPPTPFHVLYFMEAIRLNQLLHLVRSSLEEVFMALTGKVNLRDSLEQMQYELERNVIPSQWLPHSFPTMKSLRGWMDDLSLRRHYMEDIVFDAKEGLPKIVRLGYLFNPAAVVTSVLQHCARRTGTPMDTLTIGVEVTKKDPEEILNPPRDGCFVHGLQLEGARWDKDRGCLADPVWMECFHPLPVTVLRAVPEDVANHGHYMCPVYTCSSRGHSYAFSLPLKAPVLEPSLAKCVLRGVAIVLATS